MRIALIAMSGVRANNAELSALGLTLPGFIERSKTIASLPSLGLLTLAGQTPDNIDLEYLEVKELGEVATLPTDFDAVAISSFTARIKAAYELADRFRSEGTIVILGGLHVTALPQEASAHADAVVVGEGEPVWPQLIDDLQRGTLRRIYDARPYSFDLAKAPMPRFELLDPARYNRVTVQTQRGCPFDCEFCASSIRISPRYKLKPVQKVISEIRRIKSMWPRPFIEFADDNSFVNKRHSKELLRGLVTEHVRWFTETDISVADDPELLGLMRDSGCAQILIGLESPTMNGLDGLERKGNWKAKQLDKYCAAIELIQSYGVSVNGCFVMGLDGTTVESFPQVLEFVEQSNLAEAQITVQSAFPGTPLYDRLREGGRLLVEDAWETCTLFDVNFIPDRMSISELETQFRWLAQELYSESRTKARKDRFMETLRESSQRRRRTG
jgi:radical SAM superfamily enzyme YgiQ (UPF0313 family)